MSERVEWRDIQHWHARAVAAEWRVRVLEEALRRLTDRIEEFERVRTTSHSVGLGAWSDVVAIARAEALVVVGRSQEEDVGSDRSAFANGDVLREIAVRWSNSYDRGAHDYTDAGCRILAEHAFRDIQTLFTSLYVNEAAAERASLGGTSGEVSEPGQTEEPGVTMQESARTAADDRTDPGGAEPSSWPGSLTSPVGRSQEQEQGLGDEQSSSCEATHRSAEVLYDAVHQMGDEGLKDGAMFSFPEGAWWPVVRALEDFVWPEDDAPPVLHKPTTADSVGVQEDRSAVGRLPGEPPAPFEETPGPWKGYEDLRGRRRGAPPVPQEPGQAHGLGGAASAPVEGLATQNADDVPWPCPDCYRIHSLNEGCDL